MYKEAMIHLMIGCEYTPKHEQYFWEQLLPFELETQLWFRVSNIKSYNHFIVEISVLRPENNRPQFIRFAPRAARLQDHDSERCAKLHNEGTGPTAILARLKQSHGRGHLLQSAHAHWQLHSGNCYNCDDWCRRWNNSENSRNTIYRPRTSRSL